MIFNVLNSFIVLIIGLGSKKNRLLNATGGKALRDYYNLLKAKKDVRETALSTSQYRKIGSNRFMVEWP